MSEEARRLYRLEDESVITRAKVMLGHLQQNLAAFSAKFPWLDAAYVSQFESDINAANQFPVD